MSNDELSTSAWWKARRLRYNLGLVIAGILAFICYVIAFEVLIPEWTSPGSSDVEITLFTTLFQVVAYLFMMGIANICYFLGPISERIIRPANVGRYRRITFGLGFWFSVLLPFSVPILFILKYSW